MKTTTLTFTEGGVPRRLRLTPMQFRGRWCVAITDEGPAGDWPISRYPRVWARMARTPDEALGLFRERLSAGHSVRAIKLCEAAASD